MQRERKSGAEASKAPTSHVSPTSAVCSFPCAKARSWEGLGEASRTGRGSRTLTPLLSPHHVCGQQRHSLNTLYDQPQMCVHSHTRVHAPVAWLIMTHTGWGTVDTTPGMTHTLTPPGTSSPPAHIQLPRALGTMPISSSAPYRSWRQGLRRGSLLCP